MALINDSCRSATVYAETDTDLAVLSKEFYKFFLGMYFKNWPKLIFILIYSWSRIN